MENNIVFYHQLVMLLKQFMERVVMEERFECKGCLIVRGLKIMEILRLTLRITKTA